MRPLLGHLHVRKTVLSTFRHAIGGTGKLRWVGTADLFHVFLQRELCTHLSAGELPCCDCWWRTSYMCSSQHCPIIPWSQQSGEHIYLSLNPLLLYCTHLASSTYQSGKLFNCQDPNIIRVFRLENQGTEFSGYCDLEQLCSCCRVSVLTAWLMLEFSLEKKFL